MSRGWSALEVRRPAVGLTVMMWTSAWRLAVGNELGSDNGHFPWCLDPQADLPAFKSDDRYANVVSNEEFFHQLPGQHQHKTLPSLPWVRFLPALGLHPRCRHDLVNTVGSLPRV
jgi:hypothetical protein